MTGLTGKHALVTGGGTGIGAAIAIALADNGAAVTIAGRRDAPLREIAQTNANIAPVCADVTDEDAVVTMFTGARAQHGPVDIVVANAGNAESAPIAKTSLDNWQASLSVNLTGAFLTARAALADMRSAGWGRILFIASTAGLKGYAYVAPYCAAKHGVIGLMRALALELAPQNITVNAVCPGYTDTPMLDRALANIAAKTGQTEDAARAALTANNPRGRLIQPAEVADAVIWLCGDGAAAMTGQALSLSGGEV